MTAVLSALPTPASSTASNTDLSRAVSNLSAWLEGMRGPGGYGGPVMHWWESNFLYTGAGFDWRYEGIIDGYRELYLRTRDEHHLQLALRAAHDLLPQQLPDGRFRNSSFQFGPVAGGTPHEAALCVALLKLGRTLRDCGRGDEAGPLISAALHNISGYWVAQLWNGQGFQDQPYKGVYVANKHATLLEALLEAQTLTGADDQEYALACVQVILGSQMTSGPQAGGTVHLGIGPSRLAIPIYTARTMNGLIAYHDVQPSGVVARSVAAAARFVLALLRPQGVAWGRYGDGRLALNPVMVAGAGDQLRFLLRVQERDLAEVSAGIAALTRMLLTAQLPSGGLPTAQGFRAKGLAFNLGRNVGNLGAKAPDLRDILPVVGWNDKAFRALVLSLPAGTSLPAPTTRPYHLPISWRGAAGEFQETVSHFSVSSNRYHYRWTKGSPAPDAYAL